MMAFTGSMNADPRLTPVADGSQLKLKRSLKIDYWNYNKLGDKERARADPMLRHSD
jgi:hypothetical protein